MGPGVTTSSAKKQSSKEAWRPLIKIVRGLGNSQAVFKTGYCVVCILQSSLVMKYFTLKYGNMGQF